LFVKFQMFWKQKWNKWCDLDGTLICNIWWNQNFQFGRRDQKMYLKNSKFYKQTETCSSVFVKFPPRTKNMNFSRSRGKISEKKCNSIILKVGSNESWGNTGEKIGLRQPDILKYTWEKNRKNAKFSKEILLSFGLFYAFKT
jgi:hypothetical protein